MAKDKVKVQFKVLKQSADVGGKYYGLIDNSNPVNPTLTMQQIIDFKKLHNYSASQLSALIEDVLQGAAELVARDGQPRNLSSLLKFEARIRGTFSNPEAAVTSQNVYVAPRMLKDIKVSLDKGDFEFSNTNDSTDPKVTQVAQDYDGFSGWKLDAFSPADIPGAPFVAKGDLVYTGDRLCPNGWTSDCKVAIEVFRGDTFIGRLDKFEVDGGTIVAGMWDATASLAAINAIRFNAIAASAENYGFNAWTGEGASATGIDYTPQAGDVIGFTFTRNLSSGEPVTVGKSYTLVA